MKISLISIAPPYRGGISLNSAILTQYLKRKHTVSLYNFSRQYPEFLFPGKTQFETGAPAVETASTRSIDSLNPLSWKRTAGMILDESSEVLIIRFWNPFFAPLSGYIANFIKKNSPKCTVIAICDNIIPHEAHWFDKHLTKYFFNKVDSFIVLSSAVEQELKSIIPDPVYRRIHHPIYHVFGDPIEKSAAKSFLNLTQKRIILYFGYVREYKGLDTLILATPHLKKKLTDFVVLAVGESYEKEGKYTKIIKETNVSDVFIWINKYIPDEIVKYYFCAADLVALPYKSATQSGIVPIAYYYNKPVIVTSTGGLPEVVKDGETGYIIKPDSPEELADRIVSGYQKDEFMSMVPHVKKEKHQYSWDHFVQAIEDLIP